jgi:antitoxin VapB
MSLNIKNPETDGLIRELARLKGVSLTTAITIAVKNEVERERALRHATDPQKKSRMEWLDEYSKTMAPLFRDGCSGNDLINELYEEETGLPK